MWHVNCGYAPSEHYVPGKQSNVRSGGSEFSLASSGTIAVNEHVFGVSIPHPQTCLNPLHPTWCLDAGVNLPGLCPLFIQTKDSALLPYVYLLIENLFRESSLILPRPTRTFWIVVYL